MIVAIGHRKWVGKTTFARQLCTELRVRSVHAEVHHFADIIKTVSHLLFKHKGVREGSFYERHPDEKEKVRPYWIDVGEILTSLDDRLYFDVVRNRAKVVIVPDLRRKNEAQLVRDDGGLLIKLDKNTAAPTDSLDEALADWSDWDSVISNNGTFAELYSNIPAIVERVQCAI